jgi:hypothetical protein
MSSEDGHNKNTAMSSLNSNNLSSSHEVSTQELAEIAKVATKALKEIAEIISKGEKKEEKPWKPIGFWDLKGRYEYSNLNKMINGSDITPDDADTAVNTFTLVSALLLAIPFGILTAVDTGYWDSLKVSLSACEDFTSSEVDELWLSIYNGIVNLIYGCAYCAMISIILAVLYYLLRPGEEEKFHRWWARGKYVVAFIFVGTVVTVIFALTFVGNMMGYFANSSSRMCNISERYFDSPAIGIVTLGLFVIGAFLIML